MLARILPAWRVSYLADGLALVPPEGRALGAIRIRERQQPVRRARDVVAKVMAGMPPADHIEVGALQTLTTWEGEYGALASITATRGAERYQRTLGLIWCDYFYTRIDGGTWDPRSFSRFEETVRNLVTYCSLGLGERRRRRFLYQPPPGWRGYPRGLITEWYAPGFPRNHGFITAYPARPSLDSDAAALDRSLHEISWSGFKRDSLEDLQITAGHPSLVARGWRSAGRFEDGPRLHYDVVVLGEGRFVYALRLETCEAREDHRQAFAAVVSSVVPLPVPASSIGSAFLDHWAS